MELEILHCRIKLLEKWKMGYGEMRESGDGGIGNLLSKKSILIPIATPGNLVTFVGYRKLVQSKINHYVKGTPKGAVCSVLCQYG
jgi:hypothetical protein